jgi:hypothetical protein
MSQVAVVARELESGTVPGSRAAAADRQGQPA